MKAVRKRALTDPSFQKHNLIIIDAATLRKAEELIKSCEHCDPEHAEIPFVVILDRITDSDPSVADYRVEPASCSNCGHGVVETTLIQPLFA